MTEHNRINCIRKSEADSHLRVYSEHELFDEGSWLARPVKTVMELLPYFAAYPSIRVLDLGCGVGRNSIPIAKAFSHIPCIVDCVDILPYAIEKLRANAEKHGIGDVIQGFACSIEDFAVEPDTYDLVIAVSALEHICSYDAFRLKLQELHAGMRAGGIVCLIISTDIAETDFATGNKLDPMFELNFSAQDLLQLLKTQFFDFSFEKETVVQQHYTIPRENMQTELRSQVCTYVMYKKGTNHETSN